MAENEHKYIFIDLAANWCIPCRQMDSTVFSSPVVANFINDRFVSMRAGMDDLTPDRQLATLINKAGAKSLPFFIFLDSAGNLVHKATGYKNAEEFIALAKDALSIERAYYTQLRLFQSNKDAGVNYPFLIASAKSFDDPVSIEVIDDYKDHLTQNLKEESLTKNTWSFLNSIAYAFKTDDEIFKILNQSNTPVSLLKLKNDFLTEVIKNSIYAKITTLKGRINWNMVFSQISQVSKNINTDSLLQLVKLNYYREKANWPEFARLKNEQLKKQPMMSTADVGLFNPKSTFAWNDDAWTIFQKSSNKITLRLALQWVSIAIKVQSNSNGKKSELCQYYDTKANLLYKLGKSTDAIEAEKTALALSKLNPYGVDATRLYTQTLYKMSKNIPTW